jgi:Fe-Mn family superoxide dismutase
MTHRLPDLNYSYAALEPYIDATTMEIHHQKHHGGYVTKLNAALEKYPDLQKLSAEKLLEDLDSLPEDIRQMVRNNGGGHVNHSFFWELLRPDVALEGDIAEAIKAQFGDEDTFKSRFVQTAMGRFGSGWVWLISRNGNLEIMSTPNQDSPLSAGLRPVLGLDVWEHAYYLKYQNRRKDYAEAFFNVVDWEKVNDLYVRARQPAMAG